MISIEKIRTQKNAIVILGTHTQIIQSILDFDFYAGKREPSVRLIVSRKAGYDKFFWGNDECLIKNAHSIPDNYSSQWFINMVSGRRALTTGKQLFDIHSLQGGVFFAENVPEQHSLLLYKEAQEKKIQCIGPSSVGLLVPGYLKLGPIGGITHKQVKNIATNTHGTVAVLCGSGGMTNELIQLVYENSHGVSFAVSFGGDRFPLITPKEGFMLAQNDAQTQYIVYYGELGGEDEYDIIALKQKGILTKPVIMHIAGTVSRLFKTAPQFGHAKAKAQNVRETAHAKRDALRGIGFKVTDNFVEVGEYLKKIKNKS